MAHEIDYAGLKEAVSTYDPLDELLHFLDRETGEVLIVDTETEKQARQFSDLDESGDPLVRLAWCILWQDLEVGEEPPADEEAALAKRVEALLDRYEAVPTADSCESYQDMEDSAATVTDLYLRGMLDAALGGKRPFRRFKDVLAGYPREYDRWFEFRDQRLRTRVDAWLRLCGLLPDDEMEEPEGEVARSEPQSDSGVAAGLTILNFTHPLTPAQLQQIEELTGAVVERVIDITTQMQHGEPFALQVRRTLNQIDASGQIWRAEGLLINPPGYAPATAVLLAELHGRIGHFPAIVRLRPVAGSTPTRYEVAEVINLQAVRDRARERRQSTEA